MKRIGLVGLAASLLAGCGGLVGGTAVPARPLAALQAARQAPASFLAAFGSTGGALGWQDVVGQLGRADVAYLGEYHDDRATHELELATLQALAQSGRPVALSLEMFETDVQGVLDAYLAGSIDEAKFLAASRPWPNYATDYRPMVEYARAAGLPVIASNVPRRLAAMVAKGGLSALAGLPDSERRWAHIPAACPADGYWEAFKKVAAHPGVPAADVWKWYEAQCLKDETMARSIALALPGRQVLHVNGAFHSDGALGVPPRVTKLRPAATRLVATVRPVESVPPALPADLVGVADVAVLVKGPARKQAPGPDPI